VLGQVLQVGHVFPQQQPFFRVVSSAAFGLPHAHLVASGSCTTLLHGHDGQLQPHGHLRVSASAERTALPTISRARSPALSACAMPTKELKNAAHNIAYFVITTP